MRFFFFPFRRDASFRGKGTDCPKSAIRNGPHSHTIQLHRHRHVLCSALRTLVDGDLRTHTPKMLRSMMIRGCLMLYSERTSEKRTPSSSRSQGKRKIQRYKAIAYIYLNPKYFAYYLAGLSGEFDLCLVSAWAIRIPLDIILPTRLWLALTYKSGVQSHNLVHKLSLYILEFSTLGGDDRLLKIWGLRQPRNRCIEAQHPVVIRMSPHYLHLYFSTFLSRVLRNGSGVSPLNIRLSRFGRVLRGRPFPATRKSSE